MKNVLGGHMLQLPRGEKLPKFITTVKKYVFLHPTLYVEETCLFFFART
jgi:hypothetical protein